MSAARRAALFALLPTLAGCARTCGSEGPPATRTAEAPLAAPTVTLSVPYLAAPLTLDGVLDEPAWRTAARTGPFVDDAGELARPQSEARFLHDADNLYLALYAADEDLRAAKAEHDGPVWLGDAFKIRLAIPGRDDARWAIDLGVGGAVTDVREGLAGAVDKSWESHVRVAVERDGTIDDSADDDEEWVIEAALPLDALAGGGAPPHTLRASVGRCDTPKGGSRRCGSWGGGARVGAGMPSGALELDLAR